MKITFFALPFFLATVAFTGCAAPSSSTPPKAAADAVKLPAASTNAFADDKAGASYAVGMVFGHNLLQQGIDVDPAVLLQGIKDEMAGGATLLTPQAAQAAIKDYQEKSRAELGVKNQAEGAAFLATNKDNPGVITLPDGLQYKVITEGTGATPTPNSTVRVNYRGAFLNGREFDNSAKAGKPAQFQAGRVIPGWTEALTKMKVGAKWQLFIPSNLAYGPSGRPPIIPPNATLVFDVELVDVQNPPPPSPAPVMMPAQPLTSDVVAVPSAEEIKQGKKPYTIKQEDLEKMMSQGRTN